jgi:hypothetical protein
MNGCEEGLADNGRKLLVCQVEDGMGSVLQVYAATTGNLLYSLDLTTNNLDQSESVDIADPMDRIAFSPDGIHCAYATTSGLLGLYDIRSTSHVAPRGL